ncbi:MAG TPA: group II intron maturase-specific domain-containing protein, partial [Bryobacteraceae bacterium]|nr:group II intron maturase-specific domain-containing protein [Bryobacteraceae bacterium]
RLGSETIEFIESRLEGKFQLEINREKTRVVNLREEGASLDFLGYTFREREKLHEKTDSRQCFKPIRVLIGELNRHLKGWANYFSIANPMGVYGEIDRYVQERPVQHLQRRSQRPYRPPQGATWSGHLVGLGAQPSNGTCASLRREFSGEPDAGNPHLRFDEGRVGRATGVARSPTLRVMK